MPQVRRVAGCHKMTPEHLEYDYRLRLTRYRLEICFIMLLDCCYFVLYGFLLYFLWSAGNPLSCHGLCVGKCLFWHFPTQIIFRKYAFSGTNILLLLLNQNRVHGYVYRSVWSYTPTKFQSPVLLPNTLLLSLLLLPLLVRCALFSATNLSLYLVSAKLPLARSLDYKEICPAVVSPLA